MLRIPVIDKRPKQPKISAVFKSVSKNVHEQRMALKQVEDREAIEVMNATKQKQKDEATAKRRRLRELNEATGYAMAIPQQVVDDDHVIPHPEVDLADRIRAEQILEIREQLHDPLYAVHIQNDKRKIAVKHNARPDNWRAIAQDFVENGFKHLRSHYAPDLLDVYNDKALKRNLKNRWVPDLDKTNEEISVRASHQSPAMGHELDIKLKEQIAIRMTTGLACDDKLLKQLAVKLCEDNGRGDILRKNGGRIELGQSWATRFWVRHSFPVRGSRTKY